MLALIRDGLSNEEIAGRLGISVSGAKYHVSEILSKLGLENRHDAARWRPDDERTPIVAPPGLRHRFGRWLSPAITGALAVAIAIGAALLVWALLASRGGGASAITLPTVQPGQTMSVEADPGLQKLGHPELEPVTKSTQDLSLIAAMQDELVRLPAWPRDNRPFRSCPADLGVNYHIDIKDKRGIASLSADLNPTGCATAKITAGIQQVSRQAPSTAPIWGVIAPVLDFPVCTNHDRIEPTWITSCVMTSTPVP